MNSKKAIVRPGAPALDEGLDLIEALAAELLSSPNTRGMGGQTAARPWRWGYGCLHDVRPRSGGSRNQQPSVVFDLTGGEQHCSAVGCAIPQTLLAAHGSMTVR
jgi:hypothetical protein